jgi:glutamate formiminotransferase
MDSFFINDGQTRKATIKARPGRHPKLDFEYRPAINDEITALQHHGMHPDMYAARAVALVADKIVTWNAAKEVTPELVRKLDHMLFLDLLDYVLGLRVPDGDKPDKESEKNSSKG